MGKEDEQRAPIESFLLGQDSPSMSETLQLIDEIVAQEEKGRINGIPKKFFKENWGKEPKRRLMSERNIPAKKQRFKRF